MPLFKDTFRWSLPLFWSAIAFAAFFTFRVIDAGDGETLALLPLGWAAAVLAALTALLNLLWANETERA